MTGYIIEHDGKQYDPDGQTTVADAAEHNRQLDAAELARWQTKPDRYAAYIVGGDDRRDVTTWLGTSLGQILAISVYRNNLTGSRMTSVRIRGTNGATYYGRYGSDWSQLVRLRKTKG